MQGMQMKVNQHSRKRKENKNEIPTDFFSFRKMNVQSPAAPSCCVIPVSLFVR